jgi:hypothetical protein
MSGTNQHAGRRVDQQQVTIAMKVRTECCNDRSKLTFRAVKALARESAWSHLQLTSFVKIVSLIHARIVLRFLEHLSDVWWLGSQLPFLGSANMHPALAEWQHASRNHSLH